MEIKEYMLVQVESFKGSVDRMLNGLTQQEITWRPSSGSNSIGLILFHVIKSEDSTIQSTLQGKKMLWETEKWYEKLNLPVTEGGAHYTADQVNDFKVPMLKDLLAYMDAARAKTIEYVKKVDVKELDRTIKVVWGKGESTIGGVFAFHLAHVTRHIGECSYIRGLQRGIDK
jgi:uncharacterized damage-inducible protein DinB